MAEVLAALGAAASNAQFVGVASNSTSQAKEISQPADGLPKRSSDICVITSAFYKQCISLR